MSAVESSPVGSPAVLLGVGQALRRLRKAGSLQALFSHATAALCESIGFERAAFFSLRGNALVAASMYTLGAPDENEQRLEHLYPEPLRLGPWLHESEALRRGRALLVEGAVGRPARADLPARRALLCDRPGHL